MSNQLKQTFLMNEVWMLTVNAAFQRSTVYREDCLEKDKNSFKKSLRQFVSHLASMYSTKSIDDEKHLLNIHSIINFSKAYTSVLNNGSLNFGVSQKLLNLYLKYLWCLEILSVEPPHFPVDRVIQTKFKISVPIAWTKMDDEREYLKIIQIARSLLPSSGFTNIAELELYHFSRRLSPTEVMDDKLLSSKA